MKVLYFLSKGYLNILKNRRVFIGCVLQLLWKISHLIHLCSLLSLIYMQEYWNGTGSMHDLLHVWCFNRSCTLLSLIYMQEYWNGTGSMHDLLHVWCFPHLGSKDSCLQQSSTIWSPVQHDEPLDG